MNWAEIDKNISDATQTSFKTISSNSIGGGSINSAYQLIGEQYHYFVKLNSASKLNMFEMEVNGLNELKKPSSIRVPETICFGATQSHAYIVLQMIQLDHGEPSSEEKLGIQLAQLHKNTQNEFGWEFDNYIGLTKQVNSPTDDWVEFYRNNRLEFQMRLAHQNGMQRSILKLADSLCENLEIFFDRYTPLASLLHGDLWSGNYGFDHVGDPIIFDPATYYGDRETDLAMTELFGGFSKKFYQAYQDYYPLSDDYPIRKNLYNLYHVLNHFNLFGSSYESQAKVMLQKLISEIR